MKKLIIPVTIIVLLGLLVAWQPWKSLAAQLPKTQLAQENPPDTQSAVAETVSLGEGIKVTASLTDQPPVLTAEEQQKMEAMTIAANPPMPELPVGETSIDQEGSIPTTSFDAPMSNPTEFNPQTGINLPEDMVTFRQTYSSPSSLGGYSGVVGSPTAANNGYVVFKTGNWYAAASSNGGQTFKYWNPWTTFPNDYGGFCCDQKVIYDPSRDMVIWSLMYFPNATTGAIRFAAALGADATKGIWHYWTIEATTGYWWSFPDLTLSNDFLYITANRFAIGTNIYNATYIYRWPLDQILAGGGLSGGVFSRPSPEFGYRAVNGATDIMYFATQLSTSQVRIYNWSEDSGTLYWNDITVPVWNNAVRHCPGPGGKDMCPRSDGRIMTGWVSNGVVGFMWNASQGGSYPYPYLEAMTMDESTKTLLGRPQISYTSGAAIFPAVAVNARGDLGLVYNFGGGTFNPSVVYNVSDDYSTHAWTNGWFTGLSSTQGPDNNVWGDYNSATAFAPTGLVWGGSGHILSGCGADNGCAYPTYFIFGRSRDMRSLTRYWEPRFGIFAPIVTK